MAVERAILGGDDGVGQYLRNRLERDRDAVLHLVVIDRRDQLRLDAHAAQRDAVGDALDRTHGRAVHLQQHRHGAKLHVGILEVVQEDLEVVAVVAILARILDALLHLAIAGVIQLRLEQRLRNPDAGNDGHGVGVHATRQIPATGRVEFLRDDDVGIADEPEERDEDDHDQESDPSRMTPEEILETRALRHRCSR